MKFTFSIILLISLQLSNCTGKKEAEDTKTAFNEFKYSSFQKDLNIFSKSNYLYKTNDFDFKSILKKVTLNKDSIEHILKNMLKNGDYSLKKHTEKIDVILSFEEFKHDFKFNELSCKITKNDTLIKKNFKYYNTIGKNYNRGDLIYTRSYEFDFKDNDKIEIDAKYNFSEIIGYYYKVLTKKNIGEEFKLGDKAYILVDIIDNKIVLNDLNNYIRGNGEIDFKIFNISTNGKKQFTQYSSKELDKSDYQKYSSKKEMISKKNYDLLKSNPKITFEEYLKLPSPKKRYVLFKESAPVEKFIIYKKKIMNQIHNVKL